MRRVYSHRANTVEQLQAVPESLGVEFDLRSDGNRVIVTHDPFTEGPTIEEYFRHVGGRPCIFNVKCEGIEEYVMNAARGAGIEDYFFLDVSVPAAMGLARKGESRMAVRFSEVEPIEGVMAWQGRAKWVWVDCFTRYPLDAAACDRLASAFQLCIVSPELQKHPPEDCQRLRHSLRGLDFHAVCTKQPESWWPA